MTGQLYFLLDNFELFCYTVSNIYDGLNHLGQLEPSGRKPHGCFLFIAYVFLLLL